MLSRNGIHGAGAYANTAVNAIIIYFVLRIAFTNSINRTFGDTSTARNALATDFMSHGNYLQVSLFQKLFYHGIYKLQEKLVMK